MSAGLGGGDAGFHAAAGVGRGRAASLWVNEDGGGAWRRFFLSRSSSSWSLEARSSASIFLYWIARSPRSGLPRCDKRPFCR
jgi:hypothetical protein